MSKVYTIEELNQMVDALIKEYEEDYEVAKFRDDRAEQLRIFYKIVGLQDFLVELNDPEPIVNVTQKIQESLNIIETNKIIKDGL